MKLLIEFTPHGGAIQYISNETIALDIQWYGYVTSFSSFRLELDEVYGGYASPSYSDVTISPDAFSGNWPPTGDALFKIILADDDGSSPVTIFDGYGTPTDFDAWGVSYELVTPEYDATIDEGVRQAGTLLTLMASYCSTIGLTLDSTNARTVSPSVDYTPSSDTRLIDMMSEMCAFFTHGFKVIDGTLYLYDMLSTGSADVMTGADMQSCTYGKSRPITRVECDDISVDGSSTYGDDESVSTAYHTTEALIEDALTNIKTVIEKDIAEINTKIDQTTVTILDHLTVYDISTIEDTTATVRVISTLYNFDRFSMKIEGIGVVS